MLVLAIVVAVTAARTGRVDALDGWLTCDGLGALVLMLVAFVGVTAALYSWGYIGNRPEHRQRRKSSYYGLYNFFILSMLAVPMLANVALMWIAVELTTLLSAFLVGFEDTPEALEAAWKYVVLTTPRRGSRAARLSHSLLGLAGRRLRAVHLGRTWSTRRRTCRRHCCGRPSC